MSDIVESSGLVAALAVVGMLLGCMRGESARPREHWYHNRLRICRLNLAWDGDPKDLNVVMTWQNVGEAPVLVDKELVFLIEFYAETPGGDPIEFETLRVLPRPTDREIANRIVRLDPGEVITRTVGLRADFKYFTWHWTYPYADSVVSSEVICRVREGVTVGAITAEYNPPGFLSSSHQVVPRYTMNYGLPVGLYWAPVLGLHRLTARPAGAQQNSGQEGAG